MRTVINVGRINGGFCGPVYFGVFPARFRARVCPFGAARTPAPGGSSA